MEQLIKTLPTILSAAEDSDEVRRAACLAAWNHITGEGLRSQAVAIGLEQQTLIVAVADGIWQRQLQTMLGQLLYRLNTLLGQQLISKIELRIAPEALPPRTAGRQRVGTREALSEEVLSAAEAIEDEELREAFLGAAESCLVRMDHQKEN